MNKIVLLSLVLLLLFCIRDKHTYVGKIVDFDICPGSFLGPNYIVTLDNGNKISTTNSDVRTGAYLYWVEGCTIRYIVSSSPPINECQDEQK